MLDERDEAMLALARDWSVAGKTNPHDHFALAGSRADVAALNILCQHARLGAGAISSRHFTIGEDQFHVGDVILFTDNSRPYGVNNGDRGELLNFNRHMNTMAVRLYATKKTVIIPYRKYTGFQLGYAMTTHKSQGSTVPNVYVLLGGPMQNRHLTYVQDTRACESTRLYIDQYSAGPDLKHILQQMAKEQPKLSCSRSHHRESFSR